MKTMGQPIKLIIKKGAVRKDGTSLIFLQYCHTAEQRILLSTDVPIPANYWNKKTGRIADNLPSQFGNVNELQLSIIAKLRKAEDMVAYAVKKRNACPMQFLKDNFPLEENWRIEQMSDTTKCLDVYFNIDDYVNSKRTTVKQCTINVINAMKAHLISFETFRKEPITFDSFDVHFYEDFVKFLTYDIVQLRRKDVIKGLK
jgi:Arm DNA-binding domain/Phage integrase SAM-like domain